MSEYSNNDYRDYLEHSLGKKPEQKAAEKAYNAKYYLENKARILAQRAKYATRDITGDWYEDQRKKAAADEARNESAFNRAYVEGDSQKTRDTVDA